MKKRKKTWFYAGSKQVALALANRVIPALASRWHSNYTPSYAVGWTQDEQAPARRKRLEAVGQGVPADKSLCVAHHSFIEAASVPALPG